ncbi:class I SAM-dependent methyltransferase [Thermostilla marina]
METIRGNIYDYPKYYDVLFGSDWAAEFRFLKACFARFAKRPVKRLFEPACGTGRLIYHFAKAGYEVSGLDLNEKAVDYCNRRFEKAGLPPAAFVGDMSCFKLKRKVDAAFNTINSFRHLQSEPEARGHLECMQRAVAKGGLYVLGFHLTPKGRPTCDREAWVARRGHLQVSSYMESLALDRRRRVERVKLVFDVYTPTRQFRITDEFPFRTYTAEQFHRLLDAVGGWEIAATYDFAYNIDEPQAVTGKSEDVVFVLRRV